MNETVWCIAHNCAISPAGCVTRQRNANTHRPGRACETHPGAIDYLCRNCAQGRLVAQSLREEQRMMKKSIGEAGGSPVQADAGVTGGSPEPERVQQRHGQTRICADPLCGYKGEPQPIENFPRSAKAPGGYGRFCRECWGRRIAEGMRRKSGQAAEAPVQADAGEAGGSPVQAKPGPPVLWIDFSGHEDLLARIREIAAEDLRTPEMQVLYWIRQRNLAA